MTSAPASAPEPVLPAAAESPAVIARPLVEPDAGLADVQRAQNLSRSAVRAPEKIAGVARLVRSRQNALERISVLSTKHVEEHEALAWVRPLSGYRVTATFGQTSYLWSTVHTGIDLAAPTGTAVGAVGAGVVMSASYDGSYGNKIVIRHQDGTETWYAHLNSIQAQVGQSVQAGTSIGTVGATGNVTGPHLHLEVRPAGGDPVDPRTAFGEQGIAL